ncbi:ABC transporter permease [Devosia sp.]|uniref:ABC transporter permease n=1 Tax=Devosia sp. TaxID=1871048 RepID=UPI002AFE5B72|nr:ABC transporter permease [Devosia sp.]
MIRYILGRLATVLTTFFIVSIIIFAMMHAIPGGPFDVGEMPLPATVRARMEAQYGLDQPLLVQYATYMSGVFRLDFGMAFQSPGETVIRLISRAWLPSLVLGGLGILIGTPLGILLGILAALRRNSWIDYLASAFATLGLTVPVFVTSMLLILVFAVWLGWLPSSGWGTPVNWILPVIAFATIPMATYSRYTRSAMLDTLNRPFVTVLRAKGLSERRIIFTHVLRNSAIPIITVFLPMFIGTVTGSIFVEAMFRVPGLGSFFVSSIKSHDYPTEMALMLILTVMFCLAFLLSDILYGLLDPRIRHAHRRGGRS